VEFGFFLLLFGVGGQSPQNNGHDKYLGKRHVKQSFKAFIISPLVGAQWFYYFGIIEDLILRFSWTLSMSLIEAGYIEGDVMMTILSPLEVFRRFIWNYFRLENEHLNNVGKFRAVRDISVAPMDCSDQVSLVAKQHIYWIYFNRILIFIYVKKLSLKLTQVIKS